MSVINYVRRIMDINGGALSQDVAVHTSQLPFLNNSAKYFTDYIRFTLSGAWFVAGHERGYPNYQIDTTSRYLYLHFVLSGKGTYNGMSFGAGDVFVIRPNEKKQMVSDEKEPWDFYWCVWKGKLADTVAAKIKYLDSNQIHHMPDTVNLSALFNYLIYNSHRESRGESIVNNFTEMLISDCKQCTPFTHHTNKNADTVLSIQKYIDINFATASVDDIARIFHFDRKYLSFVFKDVTGITMQSYIQKAKLQCAANHLIIGKLSIEDIASVSGYANYSSFVKAFKKEYSLTPTEFVRIYND